MVIVGGMTRPEDILRKLLTRFSFQYYNHKKRNLYWSQNCINLTKLWGVREKREITRNSHMSQIYAEEAYMAFSPPKCDKDSDSLTKNTVCITSKQGRFQVRLEKIRLEIALIMMHNVMHINRNWHFYRNFTQFFYK